MSSRHPEEGAGREYVDPFDRSCDSCGKTVYASILEQRVYNDRIHWMCETCAIRRDDDANRDWHDSEMERAKGWVLL